MAIDRVQSMFQGVVQGSCFAARQPLFHSASAATMDFAPEPTDASATIISASAAPAISNHVSQSFCLGALGELDNRLLEMLASDPCIPVEFLEELGRHANPEVRGTIGDNRNAPASLLLELAGDENPDVRYQLAENPHISVELLRLLAEDDNPYVACRAQKTISRLQAEV